MVLMHMLTISRQPHYAFSTITITSVSAASCLVCALHSSKDDPSTWDLDWHVPQYLYINVVDADPFLLIGRLGLLDFAPSGEFRVLDPFQTILTFITSSPAVCASFAALCASVCAFDDDNLHLNDHERRQH